MKGQTDHNNKGEFMVRGTWIVNMTCLVTKEVICEDCTEDEARESPFDFVVEEKEIETVSWEVNNVEPNE